MKKIGKIIFLLLLFCGGFAIGLASKYYIDEWRAQRNVAAWQSVADAVWDNDTYGGATPEETFDMYLTALKKGDLELASGYFYLIMREGEYKFLKEMQENGELAAYINELSSVDKSKWKKTEQDDKISVQYSGYREQVRTVDIFDNNWNTIEKKLPIGNFKATAVFQKLNNIWKIYSL